MVDCSSSIAAKKSTIGLAFDPDISVVLEPEPEEGVGFEGKGGGSDFAAAVAAGGDSLRLATVELRETYICHFA